MTIRHAADDGDAGDGSLHVGQVNIGVAVLVVGLAVAAVFGVGKIGEVGGEAAAAHAAYEHIGRGVVIVAKVITRPFYPHLFVAVIGLRPIHPHQLCQRIIFKQNSLGQGIVADADGAAGIAVGRPVTQAAHQTAYADIVAVGRGVQCLRPIPEVGAVDRNVHHSGAVLQVHAGHADQTAYRRLAQGLLILAVIPHGIARDGAVFNGALAKIILIIIGDAHQPAQGVGRGVFLGVALRSVVLVRIPCGRLAGALNNRTVVAVKHDVFDRRARRGAEQAHVVAVGVDGDVFDVVALPIVDAAEPVVQCEIIFIPILLALGLHGPGDGLERSVLFAVEVVGLRPAPLGAVRLCGGSFLLPLACDGGILQIGEVLVSILRDVGAHAARAAAGIAPVDELQLLHGADLVLLFRARLAEVLRVFAHILDRAEGIRKEGADGVGVCMVSLLQSPCAVGVSGGFHPQTVHAGLIAEKVVAGHLLGQCLRHVRSLSFQLERVAGIRRDHPGIL